MKSLRACVVLGLALLFSCPHTSAGDKEQKDFKDVAPAELAVEFVPPTKDPKTGFVVGGKNTTALIRALKEINGIPIKNLESEMRPGKSSQKGFLGPTESLLEVLAADNDYVLGNLGLTHQELARPMLLVAGIAKKQLRPGTEEAATFRYRGRRLRVALQLSRGMQPSPFEDETRTNSIATVENLDNGKKLKYSLLVPMMIERYGFYEGKGTPYRVEPREIVAVFDFLLAAKTKE
jgi:hypothetical protein